MYDGWTAVSSPLATSVGGVAAALMMEDRGEAMRYRLPLEPAVQESGWASETPSDEVHEAVEAQRYELLPALSP